MDEQAEQWLEMLNEAERRAISQGFRYPLHITIQFANGRKSEQVVPDAGEDVYMVVDEDAAPSEPILFQIAFPATIVVREYDMATGEMGSRMFKGTLQAFGLEEMDRVAKRIVEPE